MNILFQKKWHVRTKENVERVRKDEENARLEFEEEQKRILKAESEARLRVLKSNSKRKYESDVCTPSSSHINLFPELLTSSKNDDATAEKDKEQRDWELKVGLLKPLGQGSGELGPEKPWYSTKAKTEPLSRRKSKLSDIDDPLTQMRLKAKNVKYDSPLPEVPETVYVDIDFQDKVQEFQEQRKKYGKLILSDKKKKSKKIKKKKKRKKHHSSDSDSDHKSKKIKLDKLRQERLDRERMEKMRTEKLLNPSINQQSDQGQIDVKPKMKQKYFNQFNPEFVKSNYR